METINKTDTGKISKEVSLMDVDTVALDDANDAVVIIDQTKLPGTIELVSLRTAQEIWDAIYLLRVRGAPAIGVTAAFGMYVLAKGMPMDDFDSFYREFVQKRDYLDSSRPTAVNLSWALKRMDGVVRASHEAGRSVPGILEDLKTEAEAIRNEDIAVCRKIGEYGLSLIGDGDGILTHCNAGRLAAVRYGTATAPIYLGQERGCHLRVFCDETRPLLQGARLTAFELSASGIDTTLICDNMSGMVMKNGWVDAVFVGCDRVAANGDTANKIGTSGLAVLARYYNVPFYVLGPTSTIDLDCPTGADIPIEERDGEEIRSLWYQEPMAPAGVRCWDPAFDVTDHSLISAIVTEGGICRPPFGESLRELVSREKGDAP